MKLALSIPQPCRADDSPNPSAHRWAGVPTATSMCSAVSTRPATTPAVAKHQIAREGEDNRAGPTDIPRSVTAQQSGALGRGVDDDVNAAELGYRLGEKPVDVEIIGQVGAHSDRDPSGGDDLRDGHFGPQLMIEVNDDDGPRPLASPRATDRPAGKSPPVTMATARFG